VLYNVPIRTAVDVAPETVARLRRAHDNVVGVKETTKDFEHFSRVLQVCGRDTLVWSGIELLCLPLLTLGGVGFVSAVTNLAPSAVASMYDLFVGGDTDKALDIHYGLHPEDYETNILIADGVASFKSEGSIRMAEGLGWPWSMAAAFRVLPRPWRDALYGVVARNRLRLFGKREACYMQERGYEDRFLG